MTGISALIAVTGFGVAGLLLVAGGWVQPAPPLERVLAHLQRARPDPASEHQARRLSPRLVRLLRADARLLPDDTELRLVGRDVERHAVLLAAAATAGPVAPAAGLAALQAGGLIGLGWFVPVAAGLAGALVAPILLHLATVERAAAIRSDLRYQVSAYLDVVTMLLAGNTGYEGSLEQAAHAGDGRLFVELRRRAREASARGVSLTDALQRTGVALGLDELQQIAATAALSAAEGAPVARTLAAKCATLRVALATEQESEARLRTSRLTMPIVGMALIFMALVIYPALSFS